MQRSGGAALTPIPRRRLRTNGGRPWPERWQGAVRDGAISMLCLTAAAVAARSMYLGPPHRHRRLPPFSGLAAEEELPFLLPGVRPPWLPPPSADGEE